MRKHFIRFLIISICFSSCQENEKYKNENLQLFENNEFYISDSVQKIIIISEQGCHSCNKTLYDFFQSNKKIVFFFVMKTCRIEPVFSLFI